MRGVTSARAEKTEQCRQCRVYRRRHRLGRLSRAQRPRQRLGFLEGNPLPSLILVEPRLGLTPAATESLLASLKAYPEVDSAQADMAWVEALARHTGL